MQHNEKNMTVYLVGEQECDCHQTEGVEGAEEDFSEDLSPY